MKEAVSDFIFRLTEGNREVADLCAGAVGVLEDGDVCLPVDETQCRLLRETPAVAAFVERDTPVEAVMAPFVVAGGTLLYTRRNWVYERRVRDWVAARAGTPPGGEAVPALPDDPFYAGLNPAQRSAVIAMSNARFSILTGGPGTGKTFTIARAVKFVRDRRPGLRLGLAAPTGKAKARMMDSLGKALAGLRIDVAPASTIHSLLGPKADLVTFRHNRGNPLALDWLVVDEASMIGLPLMAKLLDALPDTCRLTLVGDADQLASVERGRVFGDLCRLPGVAVSRLGESRRFPPDGDIARLAAAVNGNDAGAALEILGKNSGLVSYVDLGRLSGGDVFDPAKWPGFEDRVRAGFQAFAAAGRAKNGAGTPASVEEALAHLDDFRVLCAMRHGPFGSEQIAAWIRRTLGRNCPVPMMVVRNDSGLGVENGDVGVVMPDDPKTLHLPGGRAVRIELLPGAEIAFASTVHKAQGSEFRDVAIVLPPVSGEAGNTDEGGSARLLTREILYTAITRTQSRVGLWASADAVRHCAATPVRRVSGLLAPES